MTIHELWDSLMPFERRWMGMFIALSLFIHVAVFFLFKTPNVPLRISIPAQQEVTLLALPETTASQQAATWITLFDPRVIALPQPNAIASQTNFLKTQLEKLWEDYIPRPKLLASSSTSASAVPSSVSQEASASLQIPFINLPKGADVEIPPPLRGSVVQINGPLAERQVLKKNQLPQPTATQGLKATTLHIGVTSEGVVLFTFLDESCGDPATDLLSLQYLKQWSFVPQTPSSEAITCSQVLVFWDPLPAKSPSSP